MAGERLVIRLDRCRIVFLRPSAWRAKLPQTGRLTESALVNLLNCRRRDPTLFVQLRSVHAAVVPGGASSASFDQMAQQLAALVCRHALFAYAASGPGPAPAAPLVAAANPASDSPVPFVDDDGKPVLDATGNPMLRPAGLDPHIFVKQGIADGQLELQMLQQGEGGGEAMLGYELVQLKKFKQGGPWDAQRIGGKFHPDFVDYATVVIGLYAAASGMSRDDILTVENSYAALFSHYAAGTPMDPHYAHLPARNVANTQLGFELFEKRRIRAGTNSPSRP
jgi:hypothetical protein